MKAAKQEQNIEQAVEKNINNERSSSRRLFSFASIVQLPALLPLPLMLVHTTKSVSRGRRHVVCTVNQKEKQGWTEQCSMEAACSVEAACSSNSRSSSSRLFRLSSLPNSHLILLCLYDACARQPVRRGCRHACAHSSSSSSRLFFIASVVQLVTYVPFATLLCLYATACRKRLPPRCRNAASQRRRNKVETAEKRKRKHDSYT